jgi:hypothetical protein
MLACITGRPPDSAPRAPWVNRTVLRETPAYHRRVLAVLTYLRSN